MDVGELRQKAANFPTLPGVYLWRGPDGRVLYVGKAQNLRARVLQYFGRQEDERKAQMMGRVSDVEFLGVDTPKEALVLEQNLIKEHWPPYNVLLKDDKKYPYLAVTEEEWPRVVYTRDTTQAGTIFGPFPDAGNAKRVARLLNQTFRLRQCRTLPKRECLYYHLGQCTAPCIGAVEPAAYRAQAEEALSFLRGRRHELLDRTRAEMKAASERLDFERAAQLRDLSGAIESILERQRMEGDPKHDYDAVGIAAQDDRACALLVLVRGGKVVGRESYALTQATGQRPADVLAAFLEQYYLQSPHVPAEILLPFPVEDAEPLEEALSERRGARVRVRTPSRGDRRATVALAEKNAVLFLEHEFAMRERRTTTAIESIQALLDLPEPPGRLEAFDASHHAGEHTVASLVVFEEGRPRKSDYRRFRIRSTGGGDDPGAIREAVHRRYTRVLEEEGADALPDLIVVDGGRPQLNAALDALRSLGLDKLPIVGLAKRLEEVYRPRNNIPLRLDRSSPALHLLQHIRDEAHRFAIGYQGVLKRKAFLRSELDEIPGVGPERRRRLLAAFGSLAALREATPDEIAKVPGIHRPLAQRIHSALADAAARVTEEAQAESGR